MMFTKFQHLFFLKKDRRNSTNSATIYLRITVSGRRTELSLGKRIDINLWLPKSGLVDGCSKKAKQLNEELGLIECNLYETYRSMLRRNEKITARSLKNKYLGKDDQSRMLVPIFEKHNKRIAALIPRDYSSGTLERYKTSLSHTIEFMKWKFNSVDIDITNINHEFITEYDFYLRHIRKCSNNTAIKYLKNFKKIIRFCLANGWLEKDPFAMYRAKAAEVERIFLSEDELRTIMLKTFLIQRLNQVKDIFLFSCFTGLSYADVHKLRIQDIVVGVDGLKWLYIHRTKTFTSAHVPLLPAALEILERYKDNSSYKTKHKLLPVLSNQKMNSYLKEIADVCGINKELTFHCARHTFATTVTLNNHVSIESVSKMLGHKNIPTTQHYAKLLDRKISEDMRPIYLKF